MKLLLCCANIRTEDKPIFPQAAVPVTPGIVQAGLGFTRIFVGAA